jgi:hypothetical protein
MANSTATLIKTRSIIDYQPAFREAADKDPWEWKVVTKEMTTKRGEERFFAFVGYPMPDQVNELQSIPFVDMAELGETKLNVIKFGMGGRFSFEIVEDNQHLPELLGESGKMLGEAFAQFVAKYQSYVFDRAFTTNSAYYVFDGVALCGTHTLADGSTYVNALGALGADYDNFWLSKAAYEWQRKNHVGLLATDTVDSVVAYSTYLPTWTKILTNPYQPDTTDRNENFVAKDKIKLVINPYQYSATQWSLCGKKFREKNIMLWRKRMKVDPPFEDKINRAWLIPAEMRFITKPIDYLSIQSATGA